MHLSFKEPPEQHAAWRVEGALRLRRLNNWLRERDLLDPAMALQLDQLQSQMHSNKLTVALLAEVSRGKSELINAIFFGHHGRRIMPAGAGCTTLCPAELGYDALRPPSLRLLPIETRLQPQSLADWRDTPRAWTELGLDLEDAAQLAGAIGKLVETKRVTQAEARALGFWSDVRPEGNPLPDAQGLIAVPRWRHALVNIDHPLLRQGIVVLDTPGLNAVGAETAMTLSLIPHAQALVFILAADAGVTRSELALWRDHVAAGSEAGRPSTAVPRLVVLNKVDSLRNVLSAADEIGAQVDHQRSNVAGALGVSVERVLPLSARQALTARATCNAALLAESGVGQLEQRLVADLASQRFEILRGCVASGVEALRLHAARTLGARRRALAEQELQLRGLRSRNAAVIRRMRERVAEEERAVQEGADRVSAARTVHVKLLREVDNLLSQGELHLDMGPLHKALTRPGLKLGARRAYADAFGRLYRRLQRVHAIGAEIHAMSASLFTQLAAEFAFELEPPAVPDLSAPLQDFETVYQSYERYLGLTHTVQLMQSGFAQQLSRTLALRLSSVCDAVLNTFERWNASVMGQLEAQLQVRQHRLGRRLDAMVRIEQAAGQLQSRIEELQRQEATLRDSVAQLPAVAAPWTAAMIPTSFAPSMDDRLSA